jgi:hypothetical protein
MVPATTEAHVLFAFFEQFLSVLCTCVIGVIRGLFNGAISYLRLEQSPKPRIISKSADH